MSVRIVVSLPLFALFVSLDFGQHLEIPAALRAEHQELHEQLLEATRVGGDTGKAAQKVAEKLHAHFVAEEAFALPPLGLLKAVTEGKDTRAEADQAISLSERLEREYSKMLAEHVAIKKALAELDLAARKESRREQQEFVRKLALHAETEETVLYPATLLLGRYLKLVGQKH